MTDPPRTGLSELEIGLLVGILIGEGHFGGDGRQPQITLRMHVRHEDLFRWLERSFPRARLYGPYNHNGRTYFQWMARGKALVEDVLPLVEREVAARDRHVAERILVMRERYSSFFAEHEP